jgi:hypothetical protein
MRGTVCYGLDHQALLSGTAADVTEISLALLSVACAAVAAAMTPAFHSLAIPMYSYAALGTVFNRVG